MIDRLNRKAEFVFCVFVKMKTLSSNLEQEIHRHSLSQSELKMQNQQVSVLRSSEKQLKQELNHLLDMKQILEKQNQDLRRSEKHNNTHTHTSLCSICVICVNWFGCDSGWALSDV